MKNFSRLVRYAWPYRGRFALSLGCAVMVALLWFTELGAVFPLLKILLGGENVQGWVADQTAMHATEAEALRARLDELEVVRRAGQAGPPEQYVEAVKAGYKDAWTAYFDEVPEEFRSSSVGLKAPIPREQLEHYRRFELAYRVAEARFDELGAASRLLEQGGPSALDRRERSWRRDLDSARRWEGRYRAVAPWVDRWLPRDSFRTLTVLLGLVMVGVAVKGVFMFGQEYLVANIMQLSIFDIRKRFFRRTLALDLGSFSQQGSADLMARFTSDLDSVSQGLVVLLSKVVREPLRIIACLGGALWLNWRLTLLALVLVPVSAMTTVRVGKIMKRAIRRSLESMSNIYKILQETFQGIKLVKAYTMERRERRRFYLESKALYRKRVRVATIEAMSDPVLEILALSTVSIALLSGAYLVLRKSEFLVLGPLKLQLASDPMTIEQLLTLYVMLAGISDPLRKLSTVHSKIQRAAAASDRICSLMDREPRVVDRPAAVRMPRHRRQIEFDDVHFSYDDRSPVLRGLSLTVRHGETIALVGPNGCGKSTLMNLLPRFYDVERGAIRIDGLDIREASIRSLRSQIGMVIQETILFEDTIAANIAYGSPFATREQVEEAARRSYAHQFIVGLPEGYETMIGERGAGLSGGQRQRIALARAMLRDPAILILDEATSAVDIQDEALIRKAIEEFSRGRTTFLITHNLGSLQFADRIVLMNEGKIEAVGTESELSRSSALFRRLIELQYRRASA
ncbi:ABC transporter ATP-binding protein [Tautonia sociabilis]|uniref:ABC transporter ATP-binding protein n=1 Tax=Tautonia sociabilis TaxID=2080755 RepID=A0A432MCN7_9BACT|nr:ABC transporter ATP-binding protein [Tautonia sociabilis]RUL82074.1 ABC transporter ATP-binding protein [Tautonia sociabilis]